MKKTKVGSGKRPRARSGSARGKSEAEALEAAVLETAVLEAEPPAAEVAPAAVASPAERTPSATLPPPSAAFTEAAPEAVSASVSADPFADFFVSETERARAEATYVNDAILVGKGTVNRNTVELLSFWVADEEYALPIIDIQEIIKLPSITPVPRVHPSVLGIISLRGTIVPVLDLRLMLSLPRHEVTRQSRILVLRADGDPVGLLVDRVTSVVRLEADNIEATPRSMQQRASDMLRGVGRIGPRLIIVLDVAAVLNLMEPAA